MNLIHAGFLAAMAAAVVPVLVHLLFRRQARLVTIGTLRFLKIAVIENAHRRRLRRWLLLAMRVAGVLLLALMFARPYRVGAGYAGDHEAAILVDQSASMDARGSGMSSFAKAQAAAERILKSLPQDTAVHLAWFDATGVQPAKEARIDHRRRPTFAGTDYSQALAWARDVMTRSNRADRRVVVLSDLQKSGARTSDIKPFPSGVAVEVVDVGRSIVKNIAIDDVSVGSTDIRPGQRMVIAARVFNSGIFAARNVRVRLTLEGIVRFERSVTRTVAAGARELVRFELPIDRPGLYQGTVEVEGNDELPFDDKRWLAFEARPMERILLVDGQDGETVYAQETYYLEMALRVRPAGAPGAAHTPYEPVRKLWTDEGALTQLEGYRAVMACNVSTWTQGQSQALARYVKNGGALVIFSGDQVRAQGYAALARAGLLPGTIREPASGKSARASPAHPSNWNKRHPLLRPLSDPQHADLRGVRFDRIVRLRPEKDGVVLVRDQRGHPLLAEKKVGKGRVLMCAFAIDRDWGDWPTNRLYLPLVHQIAAYATGRLDALGRVRHRTAGHFASRAPGIVEKEGRVTVTNADPRESNVKRMTIAEFRKRYNLRRTTSAGGLSAGLAAPKGAERPNELWRYFLWALLAVLMLETLLANRTPA